MSSTQATPHLATPWLKMPAEPVSAWSPIGLSLYPPALLAPGSQFSLQAPWNAGQPGKQTLRPLSLGPPTNPSLQGYTSLWLVGIS